MTQINKNLISAITRTSAMALFSRLVSAVVNKRFRGTPPNPPAKNFKKVFGHLILMHVVIGVFNAIANRSKAASV